MPASTRANATSPETKFGRASMTFTREKTRNRSVGDDKKVERDIIYIVAMVETLAHFTAKCPKRARPKAEKKLACFFRITIGKLIDDGKMGWTSEPERREFVLFCADYLGERASEISVNESWLTPEAIEAAARRLLCDPHGPCPLPDHRQMDEVLGTSCTILANEISLRLADTSMPKKQCAD
jgi:hypothetical protein